MDSNIFAKLARERREREEEESGSEFELVKPKDKPAKPLGAPKPKRVLELPQTPTKGKDGEARTAKETENTGITAVIKAVLALADQLRVDKAQQEAEHTTLAQEVAALRTEIAALRTEILVVRKDNEAVKKKLEESAKASRPAWVNSKPWTNITPNSQEWPSLPSTQTHSTTAPTKDNQVNTGKQQYQERIVTITLGKAIADVQGKSMETLKKIAQEELSKEESTKEVQVIAVATPVQGRLEIITKTKAQAQAARENKKWIRGFGEGAKAKEAT